MPENTKVYLNSVNHELISNISGCMEKQIFITTDEVMMRGFDYRSPTKMLHLYILKSFATQRQALQALNRVGRRGD